MNLVKAKLIPKDSGVKEIEFMFNPTELIFERIVETSDNTGSHTQKEGQPKVSFANINPYKVTINKILFDTYETGENVEKYIAPFKRGVQFDDKLVGEKKLRPPLYRFVWGGQEYLRSCFIEKLTYKLTMFLPDGKPVRALIDSLTLKEADEEKANLPMSTPAASAAQRRKDSMQNRQGNSKPAGKSQQSKK